MYILYFPFCGGCFCFILFALVIEVWIIPVAQSMPYYYPWSSQSPLLILLINLFSFIPIPYLHSPLSTGHDFTVLMVSLFECILAKCSLLICMHIFKKFVRKLLCIISYSDSSFLCF